MLASVSPVITSVKAGFEPQPPHPFASVGVYIRVLCVAEVGVEYGLQIAGDAIPQLIKALQSAEEQIKRTRAMVAGPAGFAGPGGVVQPRG